MPESRPSFIAVICHPHPLFQGNMHNKVVTTLAKTFQSQQYASLRFNFRGVGQSAGTHAFGMGEVEDVLAIFNYVATTYPNSKIIIAGFSFGGAMAIKAASEYPVANVIAVAPAVRYLSHEHQLYQSPWAIVHGTADDVIPYSDMMEFYKHCSLKPDLLIVEGASHFFHGRLIELKDRITQYIHHAIIT